MAPDAVTSTRNDHRPLEELFGRLRAGSGDRAALVAEVAARLTAKDTGHLLRNVRNLIGSPHFDEALEQLAAAVTHHGENLDDATRDELYAMAKAADIPGRSAMKKDELAQALREQV